MPYRPDVREYRSFKASNFVALEDENSNEPSYRVRGHYSTWNQEYCLYERTGSWPAEYEQIDRHAFVNADMSDVIFQENHEDSPLARIRNNSLILGEDETGPWCEAYLGGCQRGRDLYESIKNGLIDEMSFGFTIADDENGVGYTTFRDESGDYHTTITRVSKIYDVSAVSFGANPNTNIGEMRKRSYLAARIEADRRAEEAAIEEAAATEEAEQRAADTTALRKRKALALEMQGIELGYQPVRA